MTERSYGPQTTAVLAFRSAWSAMAAAHAARNALDADDQQTLLDAPDAPQVELVSRTLVLTEHWLTLEDDDEGDEEGQP